MTQRHWKRETVEKKRALVERLRRAEVAAGVNDEIVAGMLDVSTGTVRRWYRHARLPSRGDIVRKIEELISLLESEGRARSEHANPPAPGEGLRELQQKIVAEGQKMVPQIRQEPPRRRKSLVEQLTPSQEEIRRLQPPSVSYVELARLHAREQKLERAERIVKRVARVGLLLAAFVAGVAVARFALS